MNSGKNAICRQNCEGLLPSKNHEVFVSFCIPFPLKFHCDASAVKSCISVNNIGVVAVIISHKTPLAERALQNIGLFF